MQAEATPDYYNILYQYQSAQLLFTAIRLDIFSLLNAPTPSKELAKQTGYHEKNLELFLLALSSCGYIVKSGVHYQNTKSAAEYLTKASPHYLGGAILCREAMASLADIEEKVRQGSESWPRQNFDFAALAKVTAPEMYGTGRVDAFLKEVVDIFPDPAAKLRMLDLGGGSGVLAIEFIRHYPNSNAFIFEHPSVANTTKEIIDDKAAGENIYVLSGDFNLEPIGSSYDLIVASGILDFADKNLEGFMRKIAEALTKGGYFLLIGRYSEREDYPQKDILNWLASYMDGVSPPPSISRIESALVEARLHFIRNVQSGRFQGRLFQKEG